MNNHVPNTPHHPAKTWILVANRAGAVIYESHGPVAPLERVAVIENPEGRLKAGDVESDRPGRAFDRVGVQRHSMSVEERVPDHLERAFALRLVEQLERGRLDQAFERFALVAPPSLLGKLSSGLHAPLRHLLVAKMPKDLLPKDLAHSHDEDVCKHLEDLALV